VRGGAAPPGDRPSSRATAAAASCGAGRFEVGTNLIEQPVPGFGGAFEPRVEELLGVSGWRLVVHDLGLDEREVIAERGPELLGAVAAYRQAAAARRSVGTEAGDDQLSAGTQASPDRRQVAVPILDVDHEVQDGPVVPEVEPPAEIGVPQVGDHPGNRPTRVAKLPTRVFERGLRDVGDGQVSIAPLQQLGGEARRAAAGVDDRGVHRQAGRVDHRQRPLGRGREPAHPARPLLGVDPVPVTLGGAHANGIVSRDEPIASTSRGHGGGPRRFPGRPC
jgi:hypothetical protein